MTQLEKTLQPLKILRSKSIKPADNMEDFSDNQKIAKQLQEHSNRLKNEQLTRVSRNELTKDEYDAKKGVSCEEAKKWKGQINDLKEDISFGETEAAKIIVKGSQKLRK